MQNRESTNASLAMKEEEEGGSKLVMTFPPDLRGRSDPELIGRFLDAGLQIEGHQNQSQTHWGLTSSSHIQ